MTTGRHSIKRAVKYDDWTYNDRTFQMKRRYIKVMTKPKLNPVASCALGIVAAFAIAVSAVGTVAPADPPEEPAVVVSVAVPLAVTARPVEVEPVVLAPVARKRLVRNRPAVRVAPAPVVRVAPVETRAPVKDKRKKKDTK